MNWKKFIAECHEVKTWLDERGYDDTDRILLTVLILIFRGHSSPEGIVEKALAIPSLQEAACDNSVLPDGREVPDKIHGLISRWSNNLPRDPWLLGEAYERLAVSRRAQGLFYTAPEIIDYIMSYTIELADVTQDPYIKVLDPACGCGYFLLKAYDVLRRKYEENRELLSEKYSKHDWSDSGIHRHIITHNLWGADVDSVAADLSAACLLLKRQEASINLKPKLLVCDSLRRPQNDATSAEMDFWSAAYHYVVGNPPYLSFGLRGTKRLDADYEGYLRRAFNASAEYKLSYYVLFMQRGIEMLVPGGKLGFIVPDSFLLGRYYSKIRRYILENTAIEVITHMASSGFKNATVGMAVVCVLAKQSDPLVRDNQLVTVRQAEGKDDLRKDIAGCRYSQSYFRNLPYNRFRIFSDLTVKSLIDKIDNSSMPLGKFASGHSGIRSITKQSDVIATEPAGETWQRGLVSGSQVQRYGLEYAGHWLNIHSAALYKGGWNPAIIKQRKILIRQTGYSLTACIDDQGLFHLNNLHCFVLRDQTVSLDYLLLLLNSRLMSFYYHAVASEFGRVMAQTDIDTLELLPVMINTEAAAQAPQLVAIMQDLEKRRITGETAVVDKIVALDGLLNQLVYRVYSLTDEDIACIESYETKLIEGRKRSCRIKAGLGNFFA